MHNTVMGAIVFAQFMNLGVAIMAGGDAIIRSRGLNLIVLELTVLEAFILESGLQKTATPAAAEIIRAVGMHIDEVFFADHGLDDETQVLGNRISVALTNDLARVLYGELDLEVLVPVGIDLQASFPNPFGIILVNALYFKVVSDFEFFQSGPD